MPKHQEKELDNEDAYVINELRLKLKLRYYLGELPVATGMQTFEDETTYRLLQVNVLISEMKKKTLGNCK
jgi:hypothetical protein